MGKKVNLLGLKFGKLLVLKEAILRSNSGKIRWECRCDCGVLTTVISNSLISGNTNSCGNCTQIKDILNLKFNKLTIKEFAYLKNGSAYWICKCECGFELEVLGSNLRNGHTKSCGSCSRILNINQNYWSKLTPINCYWAGFLAADGNVYSDRNTIQLSLAIKDEDHVRRLAKEIDWSGEVETVKNGSASQIMFSSRRMKLDLFNKFNIGPKKSQTLLGPNINSINEITAFILGYIDGDGHISRYTLEIVGNKEFLEWIRLFLETTFNIKHYKIYEAIGMFRYRISSVANLLKFFNHFAILNNIPVLKRKWYKWDRYICKCAYCELRKKKDE